MSTEAKFNRSAWWVLPVALLGMLLAACPEEEATPSAEDVSEGADVTDTADDSSDGDPPDGEDSDDAGVEVAEEDASVEDTVESDTTEDSEDTDTVVEDVSGSDTEDDSSDAASDEVTEDTSCEPHTECFGADVYVDDCVTRTLLEECTDGSYCIDGACRDTPLGCHEDALWRFYEGEPWSFYSDCFPRGRCEETPDGSARCNEECEGRMRCEDERAVTSCGDETWVYEDCAEYGDGWLCATFGRGTFPSSYCHHERETYCSGDDIYLFGNLYRSCGGEVCQDWGLPYAHCTCPTWRQGTRCVSTEIWSYDCSGYTEVRSSCDGWGCFTRLGGGGHGDTAECCGPSSWHCEGDVLHGCINEGIGPFMECEHGCVDGARPHCCDPESEECE